MSDISRTLNKVLAHLEQAEKELGSLQETERREGRVQSWIALLQHVQREMRLAKGQRAEEIPLPRLTLR